MVFAETKATVVQRSASEMNGVRKGAVGMIGAERDFCMHDFHIVEEGGRWTATRRYSQRGAGWFLGLFSLACIGAAGWMMWTRELMAHRVGVLALAVALLMGLLSGWVWLALVFGLSLIHI